VYGASPIVGPQTSRAFHPPQHEATLVWLILRVATEYEPVPQYLLDLLIRDFFFITTVVGMSAVENAH
jgi:hypothetical protein